MGDLAKERLQADREPRRARPFLKWAGGKSQLLDQLRPLFPREHAAYFEPFVGGGAVFFDHRPRRAFLRDINEELIDCYLAVKRDVEHVIDALEQHALRHDKAHFYEVRDKSPSDLPLHERAARTIYLNRTGFNGLYRVNRAGDFNVPIGRYSNPRICDKTNLRACARALAGVSVEFQDFECVLDEARPGDFVYFDPPYAPVSATADFTAYSARGFGWELQKKLASVFAELGRKGVLVMLSNSDLPRVRELYRKFTIHPVVASRSINSRGDRRGKMSELVVTSYALDQTRAARETA